jgi:hypothetical protein
VESDNKKLVLPIQTATKIDIGRLLRELQNVDDFLKQAAIREPGTSVKLPKTSRLVDEFVEANKINMLHHDDRVSAINFLMMVRAKAPVLHMSFSADPSPQFQQKLMTWLRREIHPLVLLQVGLQPTIGAGCVIRSTNKYFDFSLREHFKNQKQMLVETIHGLESDKPVEPKDNLAPPLPPAPPAEQTPTAPVVSQGAAS